MCTSKYLTLALTFNPDNYGPLHIALSSTLPLSFQSLQWKPPNSIPLMVDPSFPN